MTCYLIAGMGFGDEGKGATVDALARKVNSDLVVRYNGGPQAAHNVVANTPLIHHTFQQFGSATLIPKVRTYLSRFMLINPITMMMEEDKLYDKGVADAFQRLFVDSRCLVITPFQQALNRLTEIDRGKNRHGSTGMGVGQCRSDSIEYPGETLTAGDLWNTNLCRDKLEFSRAKCKERLLKLKIATNVLEPQTHIKEMLRITSDKTVSWYLSRYASWIEKVNLVYEMPRCHNPIFEGAQGVMLDEKHGFQPHTTWTNTTFENADQLLDEAKNSDTRIRIGVLRSYYTRHGAGPLPSETSLCPTYKFPRERDNTTQLYTGAFRCAPFDFPSAKRAIQIVNGIDCLAINHLDWHPLFDEFPVQLGNNNSLSYMTRNDFLKAIESKLGPIAIKSCGSTTCNRGFDMEILNAQISYVKRTKRQRKVNCCS